MNLSDYNQIPSPAFVLDLKRFTRNLDLLREIQEKADINIILAMGRKVLRYPECHAPKWWNEMDSGFAKDQEL